MPAETATRCPRIALWAVMVVGAALVVAPFAIGMPGKASSGQDMMDDFRPLMASDNVETTATYYDDVFVPLGEVAPAMSEENVTKFQGYLSGLGAVQQESAMLIPALAQMTGASEAQVGEYFAQQFPAMAGLLQGLPQMGTDFNQLLGLMAANVDIFERVPAGLDHYRPLVDTMQANVGTYEDADALPSFNLLTWFFVVPGAALFLLSAYGLFGDKLGHIHLHKAMPHPTA